jgi:hypothetical protein
MQWIIITMWCDVNWERGAPAPGCNVLLPWHYPTSAFRPGNCLWSTFSNSPQNLHQEPLGLPLTMCPRIDGRQVHQNIIWQVCIRVIRKVNNLWGKSPWLGETEYNMLNKAWISTKGKSQGSKPRNPPRLEQCNSEICALQFGVALLCVCFFVQWGKGCSRA